MSLKSENPEAQKSASSNSILKNKQLKSLEKKIELEQAKYDDLVNSVTGLQLQVDINILNEKIKYKESQLKKLDISIKRSEDKQLALQKKSRSLGEKTNRARKDSEIASRRLTDTIKDLEKQIQSKRFELRELEDKTNSYLKKSEDAQKIVNDRVVEKEELVKFYEDKLIAFRKVRSDILSEIEKLKKEAETISRDNLNRQMHFNALYKSQEEDKEKLKSELKSYSNKIGDAKLKLQEIERDTATKLKTLRAKEENLIARESALIVQKEEQDRRERRLNSYERLYE